jgi:hypothetical protein
VTDVLGHLVGEQFGGPGGLQNIVAMTQGANGPKGMRLIEDKAHDAIVKWGQIVDYKATPIYTLPWPTNAPDEVMVTFSLRDVKGNPLSGGLTLTVLNYI